MFVFIIGLNSLFHIYIFLWNMTCKKPILNKEILLLLLLDMGEEDEGVTEVEVRGVNKMWWVE